MGVILLIRSTNAWASASVRRLSISVRRSSGGAAAADAIAAAEGRGGARVDRVDRDETEGVVCGGGAVC